jgi:plastocyanin
MTRVLIALVVVLALMMPAHASPEATIVIEATRLVPPVLTTMAGERVEFVNRAQRPVHVEFADSGRGHHVVQVPAGGPIWAIFHRPGTHPYVVHVYHGTRTDTLAGSVEVAEDPHHKYQSPECVATIMGVCIEP